VILGRLRLVGVVLLAITVDEQLVRHVAALARLRLTEDEVHRLGRELSSILTYMEQLEEVDTADVPPMAHVATVVTKFRDDEPAPSLRPEAALANAPASEGTLFAVPKVLGTDSEDPEAR
jgi:aspartyl-tRNA(Asn)/glutamyl-tRNA(Gln) amidotransferase subunit C